MKLDEHYVNPRLVAIYDLENPLGIDSDFYMKLATDLKAKRIIDLGCGTGLLTRALVGNGRKLYGVDPSPAMLTYARQQDGAEKVTWIEGDASIIQQWEADLAIMTGNVPQIFLENADWATTLRYLHSSLKVGGRLAFESRNPLDKGWERWTREQTFQTLATPFGPIETWVEIVDVKDNLVHFEGINIFKNSGEEYVVSSTLRFRSREEIIDSLTKAGFAVEHVYGDWNWQPMRDNSRAMVFVAKRK